MEKTDVLQRRLISSAVVIAVVILLSWLDYRIGETYSRPGTVLVAVVIAVALLGGEELRRMVAPGPARPRPIATGVAILLAVLPACAPVFAPQWTATCPLQGLGLTAMGWAAALGWTMLVEMVPYRPESQAMDRIMRTSFIFLYIGLLSFWPQLRFIQGNAWGLIALFSLIVTVKMSDSFAYLVGKAFGRRKMTPVLSPGKTVEGGLAAVAFGMIGALIVLFPVAYLITGSIGRTTLASAALFGAVVTVVGIWGDLVESLIKRESKFKDSGALIPGMGGVLDVIDSLLGAAPMAFALWAIGLVGP